MEWAVKSFIWRLEVFIATFTVWTALVWTESEGSTVRRNINFVGDGMIGFYKKEAGRI